MVPAWPRFMKLATLAAFLDVSEPTIRQMERKGIIPKRHTLLGTFDSEGVIKALTKAAIGEEPDAGSSTARAIERIQREASARRRNGANV